MHEKEIRRKIQGRGCLRNGDGEERRKKKGATRKKPAKRRKHQHEISECVRRGGRIEPA